MRYFLVSRAKLSPRVVVENQKVVSVIFRYQKNRARIKSRKEQKDLKNGFSVQIVGGVNINVRERSLHAKKNIF